LTRALISSTVCAESQSTTCSFVMSDMMLSFGFG
jgi:hypothetical protein